MADLTAQNKWEPLATDNSDREKIWSKSRTFAGDVWFRFRRKPTAIAGFVIIIALMLFALVGPLFTPYDYSVQNLEVVNVPPVMKVYQIPNGDYLYITTALKVISVTPDGKLSGQLRKVRDESDKSMTIFDADGTEVALYYGGSPYVIADEATGSIYPSKTMLNKSYILGTDALGRDVLTRLMYGTRISMLVALMAAFVNLIIGILYGGISGYLGGTVDMIMMRIVDIISTIPLTLYVILIMQVLGAGMNENVILEKNENYWDAENVSLQKVTFRYVLDQATALTAYESGEVDGVASIPSSDFARLKAENAGVQTSPSYGTVYYDFNCSAEPVNNVLVRKAICLAIDRQSIIDNVVQVDAQPAYSFLAPGYSVDGKDITEGRESFGLSATADVEGAQAALAEAGYPNGEGFPTLTLSYYDNDTVKKVVEAMAEMLKNNLNINVEVSSNEWSIFYDDVQKGNYQVAAMGWSADYVNPMSFLPLCKTGDSSNNLFYSNADYDALVDQVKAENDPAKAAELTLQADAIVSNDYAVLPLYYKSNNYLMHDNISGFYMTASGNLFFKDVKVG